MQKGGISRRFDNPNRRHDVGMQPSGDNLKARAVRGAGVNFATQLAGLFLQTASVIVLARLLTPKDFGLVAMVTAFSMWFMNFGFNGFTEYIIQKEDHDLEEINSIFWAHNLIAGLLAIVFSAVGYLLVGFYAEPALLGIAVLMSGTFVLVSLYTSHLAILKRELRFSSIAVVSLAASFLSILLAIGAAAAGMGYWAVVIRQLTQPLVIAIGAWVICPWRPGFPTRLSRALPGLKYAIQVYLNFSLKYLRQHIDKVFLGKFSGPELLGHYDRAYYLSTMPAEQFLTPLHDVVLATLSRLTNDTKRFVSYFAHAVSMVSILGILAALVLTLTAADLIRLLLGPDWAYAGKIVRAFGPGIAGMIIYETNSWLHLSLGTPNRWLRWNILASILTIVAFAFAAPHGPIAIALAFSVMTNLLVIPALWYAGRPLKLALKTLIAPFWSYYVSAVFVCVFWLAASTHWNLLRDSLAQLGLVGRLVAVGSLVSALYVLVIIILERSFRSVQEVISFVKIFFVRHNA